MPALDDIESKIKVPLIARGHDGSLPKEHPGSNGFGEEHGLVSSARGLEFGVRSVRRFGRSGGKAPRKTTQRPRATTKPT